MVGSSVLVIGNSLRLRRPLPGEAIDEQPVPREIASPARPSPLAMQAQVKRETTRVREPEAVPS
jgi:hypothetical protein